jgi:hypothetical protein
MKRCQDRLPTYKCTVVCNVRYMDVANYLHLRRAACGMSGREGAERHSRVRKFDFGRPQRNAGVDARRVGACAAPIGVRAGPWVYRTGGDEL